MSTVRATEVLRVHEGAVERATDRVAVEEPLEVRAGGRVVTVTMRTPGEDEELAVGFLFTEGVVRAREEILGVRAEGGGVAVELAPAAVERLGVAERRFYATSACGVCGKAGADALRAEPASRPPDGVPVVAAEVVNALPGRLRRAQVGFAATGGLHAAGLFGSDGEVVAVREDVGRHNAVDKLMGARLMAGALPARGHILVVSGRASFELVQKALMAEVPVMVAVGAPSSAAVELAEAGGMTLLGFVRDGRFNVYAGGERVAEVGRG